MTEKVRDSVCIITECVCVSVCVCVCVCTLSWEAGSSEWRAKCCPQPPAALENSGGSDSTTVQWVLLSDGAAFTVASQQEGPGFESRSFCLTSIGSWVRYPAGAGPFCVKFACSLCVCEGCECKRLFVSTHQPFDELATCPVRTPPSPSVSWENLDYPKKKWPPLVVIQVTVLSLNLIQK